MDCHTSDRILSFFILYYAFFLSSFIIQKIKWLCMSSIFFGKDKDAWWMKTDELDQNLFKNTWKYETQNWIQDSKIINNSFIMQSARKEIYKLLTSRAFILAAYLLDTIKKTILCCFITIDINFWNNFVIVYANWYFSRFQVKNCWHFWALEHFTTFLY